MRTRLALALALLAAIAALLWLRGRSAPPVAPPVVASAAPVRSGARASAPVVASAPAVASSTPDGKVWLSGHVLDEGEQPIAGAQVRAVVYRRQLQAGGAGGAPLAEAEGAPGDVITLAETTSDALGAFDLAVVPISLTVEAKAAGFVTGELSVEDPAHETAEVTLERANALVGRVELAATGAPVPGAQVTAVLSIANDPDVPAVTTDAQGRFRIDGLASGRYKPWASKPGLLGQTPESVLLQGGTESEPVVIRLLGVRHVRGSLRKIPTGELCQDGYVELRADSILVPFLRAPVGPDGKIALETVPDGTYTVQVGCSDHVVQMAKPLSVTRDLDDVAFVFDLNIPLHSEPDGVPRGEVRGTVVDTSGQPVSQLNFSFNCPSNSSSGDTDESGAFGALVPLELCRLEVQWAGDPLTVLEPSAPVLFTPDTIHEPLRVVVDTSAFAFLAGSVSQAGAPVAGAQVMTVCDGRDSEWAFEGETDEAGQFRVRMRGAGPCWVRAWLDEYDSMEAGPVAPGASIALELRAPGSLRGQVARPGGALASLFSIDASPLLRGVSLRPRRYETFFDSDGRWRIKGIGSGQFRVTAECGEESTHQDVQIEPGSEGELRLTLEPSEAEEAEAEGAEAEDDQAEDDQAEAAPDKGDPGADRKEAAPE